MEIREASARDRDAVIELWQQAGLTRPWNDPATDFDRAVLGPTSAVLVGIDGTDLVCTAMVGQDGHRGWVYYVTVASPRRAQGLGRLVMAAAEAWLREHGAPKAQLMVRHENAAARGFYEALGYEDAQTTVLGRWLP